MGLAGQIPVGRIAALALDQPQVFQAGQMRPADIEQMVVLIHDFPANRMLDAAAVRSLSGWNSV
jgi:hypothetical protein